MAGKGGYQRPANPATSSGPGAMSQRTDGGVASKQAQRYISGMPNYGDGQELQQLQSMAPLAATPSAKPMTPTQVQQAAEQQGPQQQQMPNPVQAIPLTAPTMEPNTPVTAGANAGPGPGQEALVLPNITATQYQEAAQMLSSLAADPNANSVMKYLAQRIQQGF